MGLFGKSFEEQVTAALEQVRAKNPGVRALVARIEGKVVTLTGEAESAAAKASAMHDFNALVETENTLNLIKLPAPAASAPATTAAAPAMPAPSQAPAPAERIHVVAKGETLTALAKTYYGNGNLYMKIFDANKDQLKDPDKIQIGQKLRIPPGPPGTPQA